MKALLLAVGISLLPVSSSAAAAPMQGKLTADEYRTLTAFGQDWDKLDVADNITPSESLRRLKQWCPRFAKGRTQLLLTYSRDCYAATALFGAIYDLSLVEKTCAQKSTAQQIRDCISQRFRRLSRTAAMSANASARTNRVVGDRGLQGQCAAAIRTPESVLEAMQTLSKAALSAARASLVGRRREAQSYGRRVDRALTVMGEGSESHSFKGLRHCPHS